ncbi:hypothetical protein Tco_0344606 [Tanacetum coccineum]
MGMGTGNPRIMKPGMGRGEKSPNPRGDPRSSLGTGMGMGMGMRLINGDGYGLAVSGPGAGAIGCSTKLRVCLVGRNEMSDE